MKYRNNYLNCLVICSFLAPALLSARSIELEIQNGSAGNRPVGAEKLEVIKLAGGMQVVQVIEPAAPRITVRLESPSDPHLLRATFGGATYNKMIPPRMDEGPPGRSDRAVLEVFERGALKSQIQGTDIMQLTREPGQIRITKIYALINESSRAFDLEEGPEIFLPEGAQDVNVSLKHTEEGMPVPLTLEKKADFHVVKRVLKPGRSELEVNFTIKGHSFVDQARPLSGAHPFVLVLWKPDDARPEIQQASLEELNIPRLGPALRVVYGPGPVRYNMERGGVFLSSLANADTNPLFQNAFQNGIALLSFAAALLLLLSLLVQLRR